MPISAPPTIPQITDPTTFATRSQDWVVWQANELYPGITDASNILTQSTSATSTTSNTIGTGAKTFTVQTGKGYLAGQSLSIAYTTTPTNRMFAVVTSYNSGTGALVVNVQAFEGSGTYTAWSIALAFNGVIANAQVPNNELTLNKLARVGTAGQVLTSNGVGADPSYTSLSSNSISQLNTNITITDAGIGKIETTIDGVITEELTTASRKSTIDGGSVLYPEFKCRAWVNFNGTGTVAIRASGNVSSITDNGVGDYTINFSTAMPDADYSFSGSASRSAATVSREGASHCVTANDFSTARTASLFRIIVQSNNGDGSFDAPKDASYVNVNIFR